MEYHVGDTIVNVDKILNKEEITFIKVMGNVIEAVLRKKVSRIAIYMMESVVEVLKGIYS